jgi:single-stranded DNA-specific DHH superfamily exonuclease
VAAEWLDAATLTRTLRTDGPLALQWFNAETVALLDAQVWGQGFEPPLFCDEVQVLQQRLVGEKHLKLRVRHAGQRARRHLVRPRRAGGRARAPGLPAAAWTSGTASSGCRWWSRRRGERGSACI